MMHALRRIALIVFLLTIGSSSVWAATPTLVQINYHRQMNGDTARASISPFTYKIPLVDPTLSGNLVVLKLSYATGETVSSVQDDQSQSYTLFTSGSVDSGSVVSAFYYKANSAAGARMITVTFSNSIQMAHGWAAEFYNVATSSPESGTSGSSNTSGTVTAGSFTPTNNDANGGNLILHDIFDNQDNFNYASPKVSAYTAGSGFTLLAGNRNTLMAAQYIVQGTSASINPTITVGTNTKTCNSLAVAFKAASAGTAPSATNIRIRAIIHGSSTAQNTTFTDQFPYSGNKVLFATTMTDTVNATVTSVTMSSGATCTSRGPGGDYNQLFECSGGTPSATNVITINVTYGNSPEAHYALYDLVNAGTFNHESHNSASETGNADATPAPTHTPGTATGLVVGVFTNGTGPSSGMTTTGGFNFDTTWYPGQDDTPSLLDSGDAYSHIYPTSTSAITFTYQEANGGVLQTWKGVAYEFNVQATSTCSGGLLLRKVGGCH